MTVHYEGEPSRSVDVEWSLGDEVLKNFDSLEAALESYASFWS